MIIESKIVDPLVEKYIQDLIPKRSEFFLSLESFAEEHHVPIVTTEVANLLEYQVKLHQPKKILEVGTAIGYSASIMASQLESGEITTIELREDMREIALTTFEKYKSINPNIDFISLLGDGREVLESLDGKYDMIFIDAAKGHYDAFWQLIEPLLAEGGIIISDNVLYKGMVATNEYVIRRKKTIVKRMRHFLDALFNNPNFKTTLLPIGDGVALSYHIGGRNE